MSTEVTKKREEDKLLNLKTQSGFEPKSVYGPEDVKGMDYKRDLGDPGEYPYTRGRFRDGYRNKLWLKHTAFGMENIEKSVDWLKWLLEAGMGGIRFTTDSCNQLGSDMDHPLVKDTLGCGGPPYCSQRDFERQLEGISLVGLGIDFPCATAAWNNILCYCSLMNLAEKRGMNIAEMRGSCNGDPLHAEAIDSTAPHPLDVTFKMVIDLIEFSSKNTPLWHPLVPCGYDMRESGIDTVQEVAFILAERIAYIEAAMARGVPFDKIRAPLQFSGEIDFFETICKMRAARRMWARIAREKYGATNPQTLRPNCSINCAGSSMMAQQPIFNAIRLTGELIAGVLGGAGSLEMKGFDEPLGLPSQDAEVINLGIAQIVTHEMNVPLVTDPLGGSYYVEWLTNKIEEEALKLMKQIEDMGGFKAAVEKGWAQAEVKKAALKRQSELNNKELIKVGVNAFEHLAKDEIPVRLYYYDNPEKNAAQLLAEFKAFKASRNMAKVREGLLALKAAATRKENLIPHIMRALKVDATYGEVMGTIRIASGYTWDAYDMVQVPDFMK